MSNSIAPAVSPIGEFIDAIADRTAAREVDALSDYYLLGRRIVDGAEYKAVQEAMLAAFKARNLAASTVKVYMSQGYGIAAMFDTFTEVETFADDECGGSRSLKRIYDTLRKAAKGEAEGGESEAEAEAEVVAPASLLEVILANLAHLTDASEIALVRDAAISMLTVTAVA